MDEGRKKRVSALKKSIWGPSLYSTGHAACPLQVLFTDLAIYLLGSENGKMTVLSWEDH